MLASLVVATLAYAAPSDAADQAPSFRREIARIFVERCVACHRFDRSEGGYRADSFAGLVGEGDSGLVGITAGALEQSEVFRRIATGDPEERMPFEAEPLPPEEVARIRAWILSGATYDADDPGAALATIVPPVVYPPPPIAYPGPWPIAAVEFGPDDEQVYVGGYHEVTVWELETGQLVTRFQNLPERILDLSLHPAGRQLAVAGGQPGRVGDVRIVDVTTGQMSRVVLQSVGVALGAEWSPSGDRLAVTTVDGAVRAYEAKDGVELYTVRPHSDWVYTVAWAADGKRLTTASRDGTAKVLSAENGSTLVSYPGHNKPVRGAVFTLDGAYVISAAGAEAHRWKTTDAKREGDPIVLEGEVTSLTARGMDVFVTTNAHKLFRVNGTTAKIVGAAVALRGLPLSVAGARAGKRVAVGHFGGQLDTWVVGEQKPAHQFSATPNR